MTILKCGAYFYLGTLLCLTLAIYPQVRQRSAKYFIFWQLTTYIKRLPQNEDLFFPGIILHHKKMPVLRYVYKS